MGASLSELEQQHQHPLGASLSELEQQHQHSQSQPKKKHHQPKEPPIKTKVKLRLSSTGKNLLLSPQQNIEPSRKVVQKGPAVKAKYETQSAQLSFPHIFERILRDADSPVDRSSKEKLFDQLHGGVYLHDKTKMYWVDKKTNANCFVLFPRALSITWAENPIYWKWIERNNEGLPEVVELKKDCWLEVHGKFDTRMLSPGILYEVLFYVKMKDPVQGWELPINVRLVLPGGKKQQGKVSLMEMLRGRWMEVPVGEFVACEKDGGEMEISLFEYDGGIYSYVGFVSGGIVIKPKE
ncbi:protein PHLOEM PROTEIN 2-LIKE A1 [Lathyrus oleraceus]|nr:protein PHLOEM PROTEIN 2-LIKE A1-like [Pisum sativum]